MVSVQSYKPILNFVKWQRMTPFKLYLANKIEFIAGMMIIIGVCWPFLLSSVWNIPWWAFPPFAIIAGLLRWKSYPRPTSTLLPLWGFFLVLVIFAIYAGVVEPMTPYGEDKLNHFAILAIGAYLGAFRQKPVTEQLVRGMRLMLFLTLIVATLVAFKNREMFLYAESWGISALRSAFAITAFPLVIAMAVTCVIPRKLNPLWLLISGGVVLVGAILEVFVRGRFDAMLLCILTAMVVLGPPMKHMFIRVLLAVMLLMLAVAVYINVLPQLGDSFLYLTWMNPENIGGRSELYREAIDGFLKFPFGQGIGSFSQIEPLMSYPHNFLLEAAYELGIAGFLCVLLIYFNVARRVWQFWLSPPHRILGALLIVLFSHMLKAGDIAMLAFQWIYLYLLFIATPLAPSWQLQRGKEIE